MKLRIRTAVIIVFAVVGIAPAIISAGVVYNRAIQSKFAQVDQRHLLFAKQLADSLRVHGEGLTTTFRTIADAQRRGADVYQFRGLMQEMGVRRVATLNATNGAVISEISAELGVSDPVMTENGPDILRSRTIDGLQISPVHADDDGTNVITVYQRLGGTVSAAVIDTSSIAQLGRSVSFGDHGHAAIVDQEGNILSHPRAQWVDERRNIKTVSAVRRMIAGDTGVERFYSPAFAGDMVAGLTSIDGLGWGVMVPQPVEELYAAALRQASPVLSVLLGLVVIAALLFAMVMRCVARPLERTVAALKSQDGRSLDPADTAVCIAEFQNFLDAYNGAVHRLSDFEGRLDKAARTDSVTGLTNRLGFEADARNLLDSKSVRRAGASLIYIDIGKLRDVNEERGHAFGDRLLRHVGQGLSNALASVAGQSYGVPEPLLGRIGGDEFAILLPGITGQRDVNDALETIRAKLVDLPFSMAFSVAIGSARFPDHADNVSTLVRLADVACQHAKRSGPDEYCDYDDVGPLGSDKEIRTAFARALTRDEVFLEYQPKICLRTGAVRSVEALVRWHHPKAGRVPPGAFLPALQHHSLMADLGEWVTQRALKDLKWLDVQGHQLRMAINIGTEHFIAEGFADRFINTVKAMEVEPSRMEVEITEDTIWNSSARSANNLSALIDAGFIVSIDDFGKGYSNFARFAELAVGFVKFDRSIIAEALSSDRIATMAHQITQMAHALGAKVVVEGIETEAQMQFCRSLKADMVQGFLIARPLGRDALVEFLDAQALKNDDETQQVARLVQTA